MYLSSTTHIVRIRSDATATTNEPAWYSQCKHLTVSSGALADLLGTRGTTSGTTNVTVAENPLGSQNTACVGLSIVNRDTVYHTITVEFYDGTAASIIHQATLQANEKLEYDRGAWKVYNASGLVVDGQGIAGNAGEDGADGALAVTEVEIDLGGVPVFEKSVLITDVSVSPTSKIIAVQSGAAPTDKNADENSMDWLLLNCEARIGEFLLNVKAIPGPVSGKFKINYQFS